MNVHEIFCHTITSSNFQNQVLVLSIGHLFTRSDQSLSPILRVSAGIASDGVGQIEQKF